MWQERVTDFARLPVYHGLLYGGPQTVYVEVVQESAGSPVSLKRFLAVIHGMTPRKWLSFEQVRQRCLESDGALIHPVTVNDMCMKLAEKGYLECSEGEVRWSE